MACRDGVAFLRKVAEMATESSCKDFSVAMELLNGLLRSSCRVLDPSCPWCAACDDEAEAAMVVAVAAAVTVAVGVVAGAVGSLGCTTMTAWN